MEFQGDLARLLPDDVLADVLGRVGPRDLAASRCVCRPWRALIDERRLLRADLLPHSLAGLFLCFHFQEPTRYPEFFARPSVDSDDYYMPYSYIEDHCNGLLLQYDYVLNPATGGRAPLPELPPPRLGMERVIEYGYLAFDPTVSSHYEVFLIPLFPYWAHLDSAMLQSEWPPSPFTLSIFSSNTGQWEERSLVRKSEAAGTVADMQLDNQRYFRRHAVCWRGALYVHQQTDFVMRISLSNHTYRVIKPPRGIKMFKHEELHLGRSQKGVYFALLDAKCQLWAWILDDQMEWILVHYSSHGLALPILNCHQQVYGPWILENANCFDGDGGNNTAQVEGEFEWNSDDENIHPTEDRVKKSDYMSKYVNTGIIGFHPYKEIIFLHYSCTRGLAYHLKSSKLEDLGNLCPKGYFPDGYIEDAFPYTPCWLGEFPENMESWEDQPELTENMES